MARPKRALLAVAGAIAVGNVSLAGGHPEDAVAVRLFLYGFLALAPRFGTPHITVHGRSLLFNLYFCYGTQH